MYIKASTKKEFPFFNDDDFNSRVLRDRFKDGNTVDDKGAVNYNGGGGPTDLELPKSLSFLNKPQRNRESSESTRVRESELLRNTNINKRLDAYSIDHQKGPKAGQQAGVVDDDDVHKEFYNSINKRIAKVSSMSINTDVEPTGLEISPVYKKSGELVRSSLKYRSKSLPCTPNGEAIKDEDNFLLTKNPRRNLIRSKSVHFEQTTPIAYFNKDESPLDISLQFKEFLKLNGDNHNNLTLNAVDDKNYTYGNTHVNGFGSKDYDNFAFGGTADDEQGLSTCHIQGEKTAQAGKNLRWSKLQNEFFNKIRNEKKNRINLNHSRDVSYEASDGMDLVLENENFPVLSRMKRKDILKINLYVKLVESNNVFLEELVIKKNVGGGMDDRTNMLSSVNFLSGKIFVKNLNFKKSIKVRYTWNKWITYHETEALYNSNADSILPSTNMDIFRFIIDCNNVRSNCKNALELCIHYISGDEKDNSYKEYWDNNNGKNYKIAIYK
ncbi:hypothetical protein TPHA_0C01160 [Tetrapisispora phaffii CBS 4417]|uniref:CBM21 domain-containing protein n=1 Tax=Tetrapisispora phaffii (strain ATCC 24235 / CBS 4417 / NBRC 1672 / NRRL Y-8282 / UCD 70-5) TaxID=1071381 RepID=G8BR96_TETPH|nr:hypothetical protein TPHA_0C01160 [Tetrapisispora phaffii CBS 4417]CCE62272.1 hypothetical protein TPHA_0C01160 [Tetrapisispora phaffii CBS 4417]